MSKVQFFSQEYIPLLKKLDGSEKGNWGVLSPQGMIEHMTDSFGNARGRIRQPLHTPADLLPRYRDFALSDKEFKPGTKNAYMDETAPPLRNATMAEAVAELELEISAFMTYYREHPDAVILNPFFGEFNYNQWLHLLHKHAIHHLKQFNLM